MQFDNIPVQQSSTALSGNQYCSTFSNDNSVGAGIQHYVYLTRNNKQSLLADIFNHDVTSNAIVYVRTNFASDSLAEHLNRAGITTEAIHENKSARTKHKSLLNFRNSRTRILVVTESSASSLDIADVSLFVNYDLPMSADTFTERLAHHPMIVKTFSLCDVSEKGRVQNINRVLENKLKEIEIPCVVR